MAIEQKRLKTTALNELQSMDQSISLIRTQCMADEKCQKIDGEWQSEHWSWWNHHIQQTTI